MKEEDNLIFGELECYYLVICVECNLEVVVYDSDEVYYFFNVFVSYV